MKKDAYISTCGHYRYSLRRIWDITKPFVTFVGLNPSTADARDDDPTIRRCIQFARNWNCGGIVMLNLFAFRSTDPKRLTEIIDPVGPANNLTVRGLCHENVKFVVCAWGTKGNLLNRDNLTIQMLRRDGLKLYCLDTTKDGYPSHPLYIPYNNKDGSLKFPVEFTAGKRRREVRA